MWESNSGMDLQGRRLLSSNGLPLSLPSAANHNPPSPIGPDPIPLPVLVHATSKTFLRPPPLAVSLILLRFFALQRPWAFLLPEPVARTMLGRDQVGSVLKAD